MTSILVVDDDPGVREVVSLVLQEAGYDVDIVSTAAAATEAMRSGTFSAALIDVWLGQDDGLDLAHKISELSPPLPFTIMSGGGPGRSLELVTARADSLGATAVLFKPFDDDELLAAVTAMLA